MTAELRQILVWSLNGYNGKYCICSIREHTIGFGRTYSVIMDLVSIQQQAMPEIGENTRDLLRLAEDDTGMS